MKRFIDLKESNCQNCYKCIRACPVKSISFSDKQAHIIESECILCGECFIVCPQNAKQVENQVPRIKLAMAKGEDVYVSLAPSYVANYKNISFATMEDAFRKLGFAGAGETALGATIVTEKYDDLVDKSNGKVIISSCCHSVNLLIQKHFPECLDHLAPVLSPMQAHCQMLKAEHPGAKTVFVGPCIAKKEEAERPELSNSDMHDVDLVMSTREFAYMMQYTGIEFDKLEESEFDSLMGESTGAAVIFGTTGGVIEAAVRTAYEWVTGETLEKVEFEQLRGLDGIRSGKVQVGDLELNIGIAHGLGNARKLLDGVRDGTYDFQAIEIMACPGGCINGGGQPYHRGDSSILEARKNAIYQADKDLPIRKSHLNPSIQKIYEEFLGKPNSEIAHKLLHTTYCAKK